MANKIKKMINNWVSYTVGWVESSNETLSIYHKKSTMH